MGVIFRQSAKGTIITMIGAAIGFITTFFIITKLLTPEEIGLTRVLVEAATMLSGFALLGTQSSTIRYYPAFRTDDGGDKGFIWLIMIIPLVGFLIIGGLYLLMQEQIIAYFSASDGRAGLFSQYYYLVLPLMIFIMYQSVMEVYCSIKQRVSVPKVIREILLRVMLLIAYLLYGLWHLPFSIFMILFVVSYGLATVMGIGYSIHLSPHSFRAKIEPIGGAIKRDFSNYTLFTVLSALGGSIISRFDIFMVSSQMGLNYSGIYTIAFFIVAVIEMPSRSLLAMTSPMVSDALYHDDMSRTQLLFRKVSNQQLMIGTLLFLLIWLNIDLIFHIIPNSEVYSTGKWVVFFLGLARLVDLTFNFGNAILRYSHYYVWTLGYIIIVTVMTIVLNYYLIQYMGITGAAIATLITFVTSYAFQQLILRIKLGINVLNREMIWIIATLMITLGLGYMLPTLDSPLLDSIYRSSLCCGVAIMLLYRQESFQAIVKEIKLILRTK